MDRIPFYVHCCKDSRYVTKMMSTHDLLATLYRITSLIARSQMVSGNPSIYSEVLLNHNRSKHWVDDANNRRHDPIDLEQVWHKNGGSFVDFLSSALWPSPMPSTAKLKHSRLQSPLNWSLVVIWQNRLLDQESVLGMTG